MRRFRLWPVSLFGLTGLLIFSTPAALAHPLDQYIQADYLSVAPKELALELDLTPGVLIAPQILPQLDSNGDGQLSEAEGQAYAQLVVQNIVLELDGQPQNLTITRLELPTVINVSAGYGTLKIFTKATLGAALSGSHQLYYKNNFAPSGSVYQINAVLDDSVPVTLGQQQRDDRQQSMQMSFTITAANPVTAPPSASVAVSVPTAVATTSLAPLATSSSSQLQQIFAFLYEPNLAPWLFMVALGLAILLGGLHALTPGHGKTLVAAYLVGSRGTARHAVMLGGIVTFTHTISVIMLGLVVLLASQYIVPAMLVPSLEIMAGLLVVGLGVRLVWTRWHSGQNWHNHSHAGHTHNHSQGVLPAKIKPGDLWALGISGGLVPCPEALGILLIAIGLNRVGLGLALIIAFSFGIAAVLIIIGLLLVRSGRLLARVGKPGQRIQKWLPLISAVLVTLLGLGFTLKGLVAYPWQPPSIVMISLVVVGVAGAYFLISRIRPQLALVAPLTGIRAEPATNKRPVSSAPMAAAPMRYTTSGEVAWDEMWTDFCDLALDGGPPHRGTLLEPATAAKVQADPAGYNRVIAELARGLSMVSGLNVIPTATPGWIGLECKDEAMASWLVRAIIVENVAVWREGRVLFLPAGPNFRMEKEIKNVVTVVAKTHHYWQEHLHA